MEPSTMMAAEGGSGSPSSPSLDLLNLSAHSPPSSTNSHSPTSSIFSHSDLSFVLSEAGLPLPSQSTDKAKTAPSPATTSSTSSPATFPSPNIGLFTPTTGQPLAQSQASVVNPSTGSQAVEGEASPISVTGTSWQHDPLCSPDWDGAGIPGPLCARRVKKDLSTIFTQPLPGIFAVPQEDNMFKVHCLIIGPFDTPYEGGFFHFLVRFGPHYPLHPPRVRFMTTGGGHVRFNPNLYKNGKVCLSILGTWPGPAWSPASNLSSVLLSLQSLMNEKPYHNEPGYEEERNFGDSERYNTVITHETIRVSVLQQLDLEGQMPGELRKVMQASFMEYYDHYVDICQKNLHLDNTAMDDPFGEIRGLFAYGTMLKQLKRLKAKLKASGVPEGSDKSASTESDSDGSSVSEDEEEEE